MIHIHQLPNHQVGLALTKPPTSEEFDRLCRNLARFGKVRTKSATFYVAKYRRFRHLVKELARLGFTFTIDPQLPDPRLAPVAVAEETDAAVLTSHDEPLTDRGPTVALTVATVMGKPATVLAELTGGHAHPVTPPPA